MVKTPWATVLPVQCRSPHRTLAAAEANLEAVSVCLHIQEDTNWAHLEDVTGVAGITTCAWNYSNSNSN